MIGDDDYGEIGGMRIGKGTYLVFFIIRKI
jgi:hypothetical protein